jgi:hypothetical protein
MGERQTAIGTLVAKPHDDELFTVDERASLRRDGRCARVVIAMSSSTCVLMVSWLSIGSEAPISAMSPA